MVTVHRLFKMNQTMHHMYLITITTLPRTLFSCIIFSCIYFIHLIMYLWCSFIFFSGIPGRTEEGRREITFLCQHNPLETLRVTEDW